MNLYDYQISLSEKAVNILRQYGMVYFAVEVRCGKTGMALNTAALYGAKNVLFLTTKKAIKSIQKDYTNFGFTFNLFVTNYEQIGKFDFKPNLIICDEAHKLGAFPKPSQRAAKLRNIAWSLPIIYLSGTPTPESYSQIYHQFAISINSPFRQYRNFYQWANDYVRKTIVKRNGYDITDYSDADKESIERITNHLFITYTQEQSGFQCPVNENFLYVEDEHTAWRVKKLFKERILFFSNGDCVADRPAALMQKLHQISSGTCITERDGVKTFDILSEHKIKFIKEKFEGKRIAIYYKFKLERDLILKYYPDCIESPENFQDGSSDTFISQIASGREGITLSSADMIVFFNIDYSAVSYFQAKARLQALNRTSPAEIYWIFTRGGIEKKVYEAVSMKKDFTAKYFFRECRGNFD